MKRCIKLLCLFLVIIPASQTQSHDDYVQQIINAVNPTMHMGICVVSLNDNAVVYQKNADQLFTPASNLKILTALAALYYLKPDFTFKTELVTDGEINNNTLYGSIYLKGDGDPSLSVEHLETLVKALKDQGITKIFGDLCLDNSCFDTVPYGPGWAWDDVAQPWNAPVDGLNIQKNLENNVPVESPAKYAGTLFVNLLKTNNITLTGSIILKQTPHQHSILSTHASLPLSQLLEHVLAVSDNLYSDALFKKIGAVHTNSVGSFANGTKAIKDFLVKELGFDKDECVVVDGSGLSRYNLISPNQIMRLLLWTTQSSYFDYFLHASAIAGQKGTLITRLQQRTGTIFAKTGTMSGISGLSGFLQTNAGKFYVFSFLLNGFVQPANKTAQMLGISSHSSQNYDPKSLLEDELCYYFAECE